MYVQFQTQTMSQKTSSTTARTYLEYKYRWVIVGLLSCALFVNGFTNNAVIPIATKISNTYEISATYANSPVLASFLVYSLVNFPANHIIDTKGLRISFLIGAGLYVVGLFLFSFVNFGFHWVLLGQIIAALGQPFIINSPAKIATFWFTADNRPLATGIMTGVYVISTGVGLVLPTLSVEEQCQGQEAMEEIEHLYTLYSYAAMLVLVLMIILMREKPPSPPSAGAEESKMGVMGSFGVIKNDRNLWKFFSAYIIIYSTLLSFGSISNFLVKPYGFEDVEIAVFGLCTIFSGVLGSVLFSVYIKKTGNYYRTIRVMIFCSLTFFVLYTVVLNLSAVLAIIIVLVLCLGFVFTPIVPVSYDLGCQLAFPVGEAQVIGILNGGAMILCFILTIIVSSAIDFGSKRQSLIILILYIVLAGIGGAIYLQVRIIPKRKNFQAQKRKTSTPSVNQGSTVEGNMENKMEIQMGYGNLNEEN